MLKQGGEQTLRPGQLPAEIEAILAGDASTLPLLPLGSYALPHVFARSALFSICGKGQRAMHDQQTIACQSGWLISHTGEQLTQYDLDIYLAVTAMMHAQRTSCIDVSFRGIIAFMGCSYSGVVSKRIMCALQRMHDCTLYVRQPIGNGVSYRGRLLDVSHVDSLDRLCIALPAAQLKLWGHQRTCMLDIATRCALRPDLSRWLYGYTASHQAYLNKPSVIKLANMQQLCGSRTSRLRRFKEGVAAATDELLKHGGLKLATINKRNVLEFAR